MRFLYSLSILCSSVSLFAAAPDRIERPLEIVTNAPLVQMLVPGFTAQELPLELHNINNFVYAPDGRLFALCYDGNVLQLKDTNGDGLEDTATHFYKNERNEIQPSIGMCWGPGGLYIPGQGRVVHLHDKGDGTAELQVIAEGWPKPTSAAGSNLDAIGIAIDRSGNIFFGLGADAWNRAYRVNKEGKSEYDLKSERGSILKLSPDWKKREIVCSGVRFTVGMAFNSAGDLFCTDQEGATWLPNGNPFDELLHVQQGRHYGFPPRHPEYLPNVIDEPSVFDYAPQHQSTCGLHFNEPVANGKATFGPPWWRGDAFVSGESRGKIWRTKLVKTSSGYVAKTDLIACLSMLTIDAVPTPAGDVLVACHSGKPDWGTGPSGTGKIFKIRHSDKSAPQPVLAYAVSPTETRIIFDKPLKNDQADSLAAKSSIAMGKYASAGERFETFRPGYQAVRNQRTMPRFEMPVTGAAMKSDKRSLTLKTGARQEAVNYPLTIPGAVVGSQSDLDFLSDLNGVDVSWRESSGGSRSWNGWFPHLEPSVNRGLTLASEEHQQFFYQSKSPGMLTMRTQLDLWQMLRPSTQPGSVLGFEYSPETVTVTFRSDSRMVVKTKAKTERNGETEVRLIAEPKENQFIPIEVVIASGRGEPRLEVSWSTSEDSRPRPLPLRRLLMPFAKPYLPVAVATPTPEIAGGDWERGKKLFFGETAACSKCHQVRNEGGTIGPDLSNLVYRDYSSVLKDVTEPSAAINPEHISFNVELKDGGMESGVVLRNDRGEVQVGQANGNILKISRDKIASMKASAVSVMPEGLLKGLNAQDQKDLFTFLLTDSPKR
jgi:putative heme-binding domain-containing protein